MNSTRPRNINSIDLAIERARQEAERAREARHAGIPDPSGEDNGVVVQIVSREDGSGQYAGKILTGQSDADGEGNLALPEGMEAPDEADALVLAAFDRLTNQWILRTNQYVYGRIVGATDEATPRKIVFCDTVPAGAMFAVKVTRAGGENGDDENPATFTYNVATLDGVQIAAGVTPLYKRPTVGLLVAPESESYGVGFYDGGDFKLWSVGEMVENAACPDEEEA